MNIRLTITAAVAVVTASVSLVTVISGLGWLFAGIGAAIVVACAGLLTRLGPVPAASAATVLVLIAAAPLLTGPGWTVRIVGLVLIAVMAASAGVRRVLPALADVGTYVAALLIYLNLVYAQAQSVAWFVPTAKSLTHLGNLVSSGYAEHVYAPPVPGTHGIDLIAAGGVGVVAILTDLIAVRLRSPAVAGLPLLVLFSVPVATNVKHAGTGLTVAFCIAITGYLALLAADGRQRLRLWGRLVTVWQDSDDDDDESGRGPDTRQLAASGRRVGLAAIAFAVVLPLVLPGLHEHGLFGKTAVPGKGSIPVAAPKPLVEMRSQLLGQSDVPILTYHTTAQNPPEQYLQVYVLNYDNSTGQWVLSTRGSTTSVGSQALRNDPGLSPSTAFSTAQTTITLGKNSGYRSPLSYIPLPYAPEYVKLPGNGWNETNSTLMVYGSHPTGGLTYTVTDKTPQVIQSQLPRNAKIPSSIRPYLSYVGPDRARLTRIAKSVTAGATTPFAKALALQDWFNEPGNFTYTLHGRLPTTLQEFLTSDKRGFCQQFAFAMAVLARLLGIPSRIAVGYTAGTREPHGVWRVTTADAHAWPELFFPTVGWTRFEPTPGGPSAQGTAREPVYPASVNTGGTTGGGAPPTTGVFPGKGNKQNVAGNKFGQRKQVGGGGPGGTGSAPGGGGFPIGLLIAVIAAVLIIAPGTARVVTRRRRWLTATSDAGRARAAWQELTSDMTDYGLGGARSESPRAVSKRVTEKAHLDEPARQAMGRIATADERARYARTPASGESLRADVRTVRRALARSASRGQRVRARLLPPSTMAPVLAALRQAPDVFGWLDAAGLRLRHTVAGATRARRMAD